MKGVGFIVKDCNHFSNIHIYSLDHMGGGRVLCRGKLRVRERDINRDLRGLESIEGKGEREGKGKGGSMDAVYYLDVANQ